MRSVLYRHRPSVSPRAGAGERGIGPVAAAAARRPFQHRTKPPAALASVVAAAVLAAGEAVGQPVGLFRPPESTAVSAADAPSVPPDGLTLRRRLVAIDLAQLASSGPTAPDAAATTAGSGVLRLNLFDDATFTGLVESVAPTFSGGYSLSGSLAGVELGTMTLVVNGEVVAGTVRTPGAVYRIRPTGGGLHEVSQVDLSRLPPLGEPIPPPRRSPDGPPFESGLGARSPPG